MKKTVNVVGAVIFNSNKEILCALRSSTMTMPHLWEFPGGKIEEGEKAEDALVREIDEELGCEILVQDSVEDTTYEYEQINVRLLTFTCKIVKGSPVAKEHEELRWVPISFLSKLKWAPADISAVKTLEKKFEER
ncbi:(deoxy)nucleoside triphosphate pyrophosphohydrolase [Bacillus sp. FJAT-45350]|uniref:(deoxy)nucleoside triphosphate pyrophosphohydrolase n=1 Tax=Bacillus sp. FJAT-45350 TaxID=2011014 RepID=UPI000BB6A82A|nr:(deoxy)nucleoside triphosphate pyrophosphohydrolase [Bacillus sp. FJAT-45350]